MAETRGRPQGPVHAVITPRSLAMRRIIQAIPTAGSAGGFLSGPLHQLPPCRVRPGCRLSGVGTRKAAGSFCLLFCFLSKPQSNSPGVTGYRFPGNNRLQLWKGRSAAGPRALRLPFDLQDRPTQRPPSPLQLQARLAWLSRDRHHPDCLAIFPFPGKGPEAARQAL